MKVVFAFLVVVMIMCPPSTLQQPIKSAQASTVTKIEEHSFFTDYYLEQPVELYDLAVVGNIIWMTEYNVNKLWKYNIVTKDLTSVDLPDYITPLIIRAADDGSLWFLDFNFTPQNGTDYIVRYDPVTGDLHQILLPSVSQPLDLEINKDLVYVSILNKDMILKVNRTTYDVTEIPVECSDNCGPVGMAFDNQGNLWYADTFGPGIVEYIEHPLQNTSEFVYHDLPPIVRSPTYLHFDGNHTFWTGSHGGDQVVSFDINDNESRIYNAPQTGPDQYPVSGINDFGFDYTGDLWFTAHFTDRTGRIDIPSGTLLEYFIPHKDPYALMLSAVGDTIWYVQDQGILTKINATKAPVVRISDFPENFTVVNATSDINVHMTAEYVSGVHDSLDFQLFGEARRSTKFSITGTPDTRTIQKGQKLDYDVTIHIKDDAHNGTYTFVLGIKTSEFTATKSFTITVQNMLDVTQTENKSWFSLNFDPLLAGVVILCASIVIYTYRDDIQKLINKSKKKD